MNILYQGIDNLDFSINGTYKDGFEAYLKEQKEIAQYDVTDTPIFFNGFTGMLKPHGTDGGYTYMIKNELFTITLKKHDVKKTPWFCKVSVRSVLLSDAGYKGTVKFVMEQMNKIVNVDDISINRVDICQDFQEKKYEIIPKSFVLKGKLKGYGFHTYGNRLKQDTITIGKLPNLQATIYDKSKQSSQVDCASYWNQLHKSHPKYIEKTTVYRIEFRYGNEYLKKQNIYTFDELEEKLPLLIEKMANQVYITDDINQKNTSRCNKSKLWLELINNFYEYIKTMENDIRDIGKSLEFRLRSKLERKKENAVRNIVNSVINYSVLSGRRFDVSELGLLFDIKSHLEIILSNEDKKKSLSERMNKKLEEFESLNYGIIQV